MNRIIGIDPGKNGAIVVVDFAFANMCPEVTFYDIPLIKKIVRKKNRKGVYGEVTKTDYDTDAMASILNIKDATGVCIESQQAFPGQGSVSMFNTGKGYGIYLGILAANNIPITIVRPKKWQGYYEIKGDKNNPKATKQQSYQIAMKCFPGYGDKLKTPRGRIIDGRCDALLIAGYEAKVLEAKS